MVKKLADEFKIKVAEVRTGAKYDTWIDILSPNHALGGENDTNTDSLVLELRLKTQRVLVLSDVPAEIQNRLAHPEIGEFSCVIVAHHGARSQSEKLASIVKPQISLISVGKNNYGHPHPNAFRVWNAPLIKTTQNCGDIRIGAKQYATQKKC
ncbi:hypothetical protein RQN30_02005 [Arcanobacterium hippocoleae]